MRPSREACDRCHSMKIRCVRVRSNQVCERCERLEASCNYSPPGRTGRPLGSRRSRAASNEVAHCLPRTESGDDLARANHSAHSSMSGFNNIGSNETFQTNLGSFDMLPDQLYTTSDDSMSFIDVHRLLSDNSIQQPEYPTSPQIAAHPGLDTTTNDITGPISFNEKYSGSSDSQQTLGRLFEVLTRLSKLATPYSERADATGDIEAIYQITQNMITVIDSIEKQEPRGPEDRGLGSNAAVVFLLSSCYSSLVGSYQCLVDMLGNEVTGIPSPASGSSGSAETDVPPISVGYLRLSMPRKAAAEVNMHLVAQTIKHLRGALQECAIRVSSPKPSSQPSSRDVSMRPDREASRGGDALKLMVSLALDELDRGEDKLINHVRAAMVALSTGSASVI